MYSFTETPPTMTSVVISGTVILYIVMVFASSRPWVGVTLTAENVTVNIKILSLCPAVKMALLLAGH